MFQVAPQIKFSSWFQGPWLFRLLWRCRRTFLENLISTGSGLKSSQRTGSFWKPVRMDIFCFFPPPVSVSLNRFMLETQGPSPKKKKEKKERKISRNLHEVVTSRCWGKNCLEINLFLSQVNEYVTKQDWITRNAPFSAWLSHEWWETYEYILCANQSQTGKIHC